MIQQFESDQRKIGTLKYNEFEKYSSRKQCASGVEKKYSSKRALRKNETKYS